MVGIKPCWVLARARLQTAALGGMGKIVHNAEGVPIDHDMSHLPRNVVHMWLPMDVYVQAPTRTVAGDGGVGGDGSYRKFLIFNSYRPAVERQIFVVLCVCVCVSSHRRGNSIHIWTGSDILLSSACPSLGGIPTSGPCRRAVFVRRSDGWSEDQSWLAMCVWAG